MTAQINIDVEEVVPSIMVIIVTTSEGEKTTVENIDYDFLEQEGVGNIDDANLIDNIEKYYGAKGNLQVVHAAALNPQTGKERLFIAYCINEPNEDTKNLVRSMMMGFFTGRGSIYSCPN